MLNYRTVLLTTCALMLLPGGCRSVKRSAVAPQTAGKVAVPGKAAGKPGTTAEKKTPRAAKTAKPPVSIVKNEPPSQSVPAAKAAGVPRSRKKPIPQPSPPYNLSRIILPDGGGSRFLAPDNFVQRWQFSRPFALKNYPVKWPPRSEIIHYPFIKNEKKFSGSCGRLLPLKIGAKPDRRQPGRVTLAELFPHLRNAAIYAAACLEAPRAVSHLILYTGSSGYIKVWLNGRLVHTYNRHDRGGKRDQDLIRNIQLKAGRNLILVKMVILQHPGEFYLRLGTADGLPLRFIPASMTRQTQVTKKKLRSKGAAIQGGNKN